MARIALVTGGTRGIGAAISLSLKNAGYKVAANYASNDGAAKEFAKVTGVATYKWDISDYEACQQGAKMVSDDLGGPIDILVNNAGITRDGAMHKMAKENWNQVIETNLTSVFNMSRAVLDSMRDNKFGRIINVASIAGFLPGSQTATLYAPVKSYQIKFSQGLHMEVRDLGVHVSALCPGYTYSEFHAVAQTTEMSKSAPSWLWMGPDEVAREGYVAAEANRAVCVPGAPNKFINALLKILPDDWVMEGTSRQLRRLRTP